MMVTYMFSQGSMEKMTSLLKITSLSSRISLIYSMWRMIMYLPECLLILWKEILRNGLEIYLIVPSGIEDSSMRFFF
jgi:hypothetical protein